MAKAKIEQRSLDDRLLSIVAAAMDAGSDAKRFDAGNNAAGLRVRKKLTEIVNYAKVVEDYILSNSRKSCKT